MLHPNGINRDRQGTTGLRQAQQNGLVVRSMADGFEEGKAGKKLRVAIDACVSKARMPAPGAFVVLAPDGRASGRAGINQNALSIGGYDQVGRQEAKTISMLRSCGGSGGQLHVVTLSSNI